MTVLHNVVYSLHSSTRPGPITFPNPPRHPTLPLKLARRTGPGKFEPEAPMARPRTKPTLLLLPCCSSQRP